jgi:hypothetical protein
LAGVTLLDFFVHRAQFWAFGRRQAELLQSQLDARFLCVNGFPELCATFLRRKHRVAGVRITSEHPMI